MFTGIVEGLGRLRSLSGGSMVLDVVQGFDGAAWSLGESVAVNGACLTVVSSEDGLRFDLSLETLARTALGTLRPGSLVNLERAMPASGRFGGHFVQGHVDARGRVLSVLEDEGARVFRFEGPEEYGRYVIDKGSVTVDGVSLTAVRPERGLFDVWVIPHTLWETNLGERRPGDMVNLEFDVIAKYVERLLRHD